MSHKQSATAREAVASLTYVDKVYTSRSLFLADGRELKVLRQRLSVPEDDAEARAYLDEHPDFERATE